MRSAVYTRFELLRAIRNRRFMIFSILFPLVLYFMIAVPNRDVKDLGGSGISAPLYFMVGLAAFGTMNAVLGTGARIAAERQVGWNRQLRITPLTTRAYFRAKVLTAYMLAALTIVILYISGLSLGVSISAGRWLDMTIFILIGLVPFAGLGIAMGHLLNVDAIGPAIGGTTALLALFGGVWFPISSSGALHDIAQALPSYWLVQAAHIAIGGEGWGATGWAIVAIWSIAVTLVAMQAFRRDTQRA
ncbi:MAG TPA: ABC transporter permease [Gaiellaceae bacterium]